MVFCKKIVLKIFANFTGKYLCRRYLCNEGTRTQIFKKALKSLALFRKVLLMKKRVVNCFGLKINLLVSMSKGFLPGE